MKETSLQHGLVQTVVMLFMSLRDLTAKRTHHLIIQAARQEKRHFTQELKAGTNYGVPMKSLYVRVF